MKKIIHILSSILITMFPAIAFAQPDQHVWHETFQGMSWNQFQDKIHDVYIDDDNNTYIAGVFATGAELGGKLICPPDSGSRVFESTGVFVAKFDSVGKLLWCRSAKDWKRGLCNVLGMTVKGDRINFMFTFESRELMTEGYPDDWGILFEGAFMHFFDTTYYCTIDGVRQPYGELPFRVGAFTYLATFDTDGNRIDTKNAYGWLGELYNQDSHGNHYILREYEYQKTDSIHPERDKKKVIINDDSNQAFVYLCPDHHFYPDYKRYNRVPVLIKIDSSWTKVSFFQITDDNNGFTNATRDSVFAIPVHSVYKGYYFIGLSSDENDHLYITINMQSTAPWADSLQLPLYLYFRNGYHYRINTPDELSQRNYMIKIDTLGNTMWAMQLYHENHGGDSAYYHGTSLIRSTDYGFGQPLTDSNYVYLPMTVTAFGPHNEGHFASKYPYSFFDSTHLDTIHLPTRTQESSAMVTVFDKKDVKKVHLYMYPDSERTVSSYGTHIYANSQHIVGTFRRHYFSDYTVRWNRSTEEMQEYDEMIRSQASSDCGVWGNNKGYTAKKWDSRGLSITGHDFDIPYGHAAIAVYYDSLLDQRRHNRDTTHAPDDTATAAIRDVRHGGDVRVSPNPTDDAVAVNAPCGIRRIDIHDIGGRLVASHSVDNEAATVHLGGYPQGVYLLKIHLADGNIANIKIIKTP